MNSQTGIKLKSVKPFYDFYDRGKRIRYFGADNLFPNSLKTYLDVSPSLAECVNRKAMFLGLVSGNGLITQEIYKKLIADYALFNGFALYLMYDSEGNVQSVEYIPFETIRLGERGQLGNYTNVKYCADWSGIDTVNTKRISSSQATTFPLWSDSKEVTLSRCKTADSEDKCYNCIFYYNGSTTVYPQSPLVPVLNYASTEVGLANLVYRDVRTNFTPSKIIAYQKQSESDENSFLDGLRELQGDENAYKVLTMSYASVEEKPEILDFAPEDYTQRIDTVSTLCKNNIFSAFNQTQFLRLSDGGLGFSSDIISEIYKYYNNLLSAERSNIENALRNFDAQLTINKLPYI